MGFSVRWCVESELSIEYSGIGWRNGVWLQWRGLKQSDWRAGYVSALMFASFATNQGIHIPRSPEVHAIAGWMVETARNLVGEGPSINRRSRIIDGKPFFDWRNAHSVQRLRASWGMVLVNPPEVVMDEVADDCQDALTSQCDL